MSIFPEAASMNPTLGFPFPSALSGESPLLYVEERGGRLAAFVFRGEIKHVNRILKMWASGGFASKHAGDTTRYTAMSDTVTATVAQDDTHRHWYTVRLED